jgi:hypothetical protein
MLARSNAAGQTIAKEHTKAQAGTIRSFTIKRQGGTMDIDEPNVHQRW